MFLETYSISLKRIFSDKENSKQIDTEKTFFSGTAEDFEDDDDLEEEFYNQMSEAQTFAAQWLNEQDQDFSTEMQLLIQETGYGSQFTNGFSSDLNLALGLKGIPLVYRYTDLYIKTEDLSMNGSMAISLRAYKKDDKINFEDFLGALDLDHPLISKIYKSKKEGSPAIVKFELSSAAFSDQMFLDHFSKVALWLDQQNEQLFKDLAENDVAVDIFIGGLVEGEQYQIAIPSTFLLACGKKKLDIDIFIND